MTPTNESANSLAWFTKFRARAHALIEREAIAHIYPADEPIEEVTFGWFTPIGRLDNDPRPAFELWLDTYLDANSSHHLGVWYETTWTVAQNLKNSLQRAWGTESVPVYRHSDRDNGAERLRAHPGRREATRIPAPLIDYWNPVATYVGLYVARAPVLANDVDLVLNDTIGALRRLVDVVRTARREPHTVSQVQSPEQDAEREIRLRKVLARPIQQQLRRQALQHHRSCVITGESVPEALEAAHIHPVYAGGADTLDNILLLRADLHRLFDAGLLTIRGGLSPCVQVAQSLIRPASTYPSITTLSDSAKTITVEQWRALATRNHRWNTDYGLSHTSGRPRRSPLMVPSAP